MKISNTFISAFSFYAVRCKSFALLSAFLISGLSGCAQIIPQDEPVEPKSSQEEPLPSSDKETVPTTPDKTPPSQMEKRPGWLQSPLSEDEHYLYGLGKGNTLAEAEQSALNKVNSHFVSAVNASVVPPEKGSPVPFSGSVLAEASADFKGLDLAHYESVSERWKQYEGPKDYVLLRVSKKALASHLNTQFEKMRTEFNEKRHQMAPGLNKWLFYTRQLNLWHGQLQQLTALNYLNEDMARSYLLFLTAMKAFIFEAQQKVSIQIQAQSAEAERFAKPFSQYLMRYGFIKPHKKPTDIIKLSVQKRFEQQEGMAVERDRVELLKEASLQTRMWHFDVEGQHTNPEQAHELAVRQWSHLLEKQPLGDLLR